MLDQYLSFICPSPQLFSLVPPPPTPAPANAPPQPGPSTTPTSYHILNSPQTTEQEIEAEIERIASGLFSVVVTSGSHFQSLEIHTLIRIPLLQVLCLIFAVRRGMRQKWLRGSLSRRFGMLSSPLHVPMLLRPCLPTILPGYPTFSDHVRIDFAYFALMSGLPLTRSSAPRPGS